MHSASTLAALAAVLPSALAAYQGFNYGSLAPDGSIRYQADFEAQFTTAAGLDNTDGAFNSARLYTMIQGGTTSDVISAIPAAINTKTSLLLGIWASAGADIFANELTALKAAISTYGSELSSLVAGISVGSEDLYRDSVTGRERQNDPGASPDTLTNYIKQVREALSGTALASVPVGHVDTWNDYSNSSNAGLIENLDFLGVDEYPFYQSSDGNDIANGKSLFDLAISKVNAVAGGKDIWITETGWAVSGTKFGDAVASTTNAKTYWDAVGCPLFGSTNVWWYTLQDASSGSTPDPSFGVVGGTLSTTPLFDLSCNASTSSASSSSVAASTSTSSSSSSAAVSATSSSVAASATSSAAVSAASSSAAASAASSAVSAASSSAAVSATASSAAVPVTASSAAVPVTSAGSKLTYSSTAKYNATGTSSTYSSSGTGSGSGSGGYGSGSNSNSTYTYSTFKSSGTATATGSSTGSGSGSGAGSTSSASPSGTAVVASGSHIISGSISAAFAAVMAAILAV